MINFWQFKKKASFNQKTYLIVGLGNYGKKYKNTRHNVGMQAVDEIASTLRISLEFELFNCVFYKGKCENINFILAKGKGFINESGYFIKDLMNHYKIDIENVLIIFDCVDIECGKIKLKLGTSGGKHNGVKNIVNELQTSRINCLKIGTGGYKREGEMLKHYVMNKLTTSEKIKIFSLLEIMPDIFYDFIKTNMDNVMQKYNSIVLTKQQNNK